MHVRKFSSKSQYFSSSIMPAEDRRALKIEITDASYGCNLSKSFSGFYFKPFETLLDYTYLRFDDSVQYFRRKEFSIHRKRYELIDFKHLRGHWILGISWMCVFLKQSLDVLRRL